jgi:uncharacterized protein (DUF1501 family)
MATTAIISENRDTEKTLVVVFLRGGADGLYLVTPYRDDGYYRARPTIGLKKNELLDVDGFFGLHPNLSALLPFWKEGDLSAIHAVGSEDQTRSHFEAQDFMEHGGLAAGGWLGRFLRVRPDAGESPLTAVAIGSQLPECLRGAPSCAAMQSLQDFGLGKHANPAFIQQLAGLYGTTSGLLGTAGAQAVAALKKIESLANDRTEPANGARYGNDAFGQGMKQIAQLLKARLGLQAVAISLGGWDSHLTQSSVINRPILQLGNGLAAFAQDLGKKLLANTTVIVMTEFGRRVAENSAGGTDHGLGGAMFLLGGSHQGGRMHGTWQGLASDQLSGPGDLPVMNNYRNVLAPLLSNISPDAPMNQVFPNFSLDPLNTLV